MILKNKIALVTGGTKGIGEAISLKLAQKGIKVCVTYLSDDKNAAIFEKKIKDITQDYLIIKSDVSKINKVNDLFDEIINEFGKLDILINNAGKFISKEIERNLEKRFKKSFENNFFSLVYTTEKFKEVFSGELGKIINISSIAGINPFSYTGGIRSPEYDCSKASIDLYTKIMAKTFDGKILVNSIAPGSTKTPAWDGAEKEFLELRAKESIIKRFIKSEEIAESVLFLLKNDAINGEIIVVDGGNILN